MIFFFRQKTAYEIGLGIPAEPLFRSFHDETGRLNVDGMNIISNDGSNKFNRSRKARVSYKVQRTINASLNAATDRKSVVRERVENSGGAEYNKQNKKASAHQATGQHQ